MVALTRNVPDVPEELISVKFIRFALSFYPVVFVIHRHNPSKLVPKHPLSNMRLDIKFRQSCYQRPAEVMRAPVAEIHSSPNSIYEPVGGRNADRFVNLLAGE